MAEKATGVSFIPYRLKNGMWEFYLQMRDERAPKDPNVFSTFGGHLEEGEASQPGIVREIEEELTYVPKALALFQTFTLHRTFDVYVEQVGDDFETLVEVREGKYGAFLTADDVATRREVSKLAKTVIPVLAEHVSRR
ncbi:MAG TPA: NUDIX domain-containing protein [Candidatus Paceibacterota bacterium]|nr:NUDIX domain-containing protein [Candidatus Paceibacterota bacterium]